MHRLNFIPPAKKAIAKNLHELASPYGMHAKGHVNTDSYAFSVEATLDGLEKELSEASFLRNPMSYLTYRKVDYGKNYTIGSWAYYPDGLMGTYQLHITLYSAFEDGYVDIYAHHERNWIRHPFKHLDGVDYDAEKGVDMLEDVVREELDKVYNVEERPRSVRYESP